MLLHTFILGTCVIVILGFPMYRDRIPNGYNVPNPCAVNGIWSTVGHNFNNNFVFTTNKSRNPFGEDFVNSTIGNHGWTTALVCIKDSDGDGVTNGEELGDPNCEWSEGDTPAGNPSGHPGLKCDHGGVDEASTCHVLRVYNYDALKRYIID